MPNNDILTRWTEPGFVHEVTPILNAIFRQKAALHSTDLRGIVVGLTGALPDLLHASFQGVAATDLDASLCRLSCDFVRAKVYGSKFEGGQFDTCSFKNAVFESTVFNRAKIDNPTFDDAVFRGCSFDGARIAGRGYREYGGRRMVFEKCSFRDVRIRNLQLRACSFRECVWDGAIIEKCIMVGVKFEGAAPPESSLVGCGRD